MFRKKQISEPPSPPTETYCCLVAKSYLTLVIPWTIAHQASLSMGFPRLRILDLTIPSPGDLPDSGIEPISPALADDSLSLSPQ